MNRFVQLLVLQHVHQGHGMHAAARLLLRDLPPRPQPVVLPCCNYRTLHSLRFVRNSFVHPRVGGSSQAQWHGNGLQLQGPALVNGALAHLYGTNTVGYGSKSELVDSYGPATHSGGARGRGHAGGRSTRHGHRQRRDRGSGPPVTVNEWLHGMAQAADVRQLQDAIGRLRRVPPGDLRSGGQAPRVLAALTAALQAARGDGSASDLKLLYDISCELPKQPALLQAQETACNWQLHNRMTPLLERCVANGTLLRDPQQVSRLAQLQRDSGCVSETFWRQVASGGGVAWSGRAVATALSALSRLAEQGGAGSRMATMHGVQSSLIRAVQEQVADMDTRGVANGLNGVGKLHRARAWHLSAKDCEALLQAAERTAVDMNAQDVANTWNALSRLDIPLGEALRNELLRASERVLPSSNAQAVANTWNALSGLDIPPGEALRNELLRASERVLPSSNAQNVANTWNALKDLDIKPGKALRNGLLRASERVLPSSTAQEVALTWNALAGLNISPGDALRNELLRACERVLPKSNAQNVANMWNALFGLGIQPGETLRGILVERSQQLAPTMAGQHVSSSMHAIASLAVPHADRARLALQAATAAQLQTSSLDTQALCNCLWALAAGNGASAETLAAEESTLAVDLLRALLSQPCKPCQMDLQQVCSTLVSQPLGDLVL